MEARSCCCCVQPSYLLEENVAPSSGKRIKPETRNIYTSRREKRREKERFHSAGRVLFWSVPTDFFGVHPFSACHSAAGDTFNEPANPTARKRGNNLMTKIAIRVRARSLLAPPNPRCWPLAGRHSWQFSPPSKARAFPVCC